MPSGPESRDEIRDRMPRVALQLLVGAGLLAAGFAIGYLRNGDALELRKAIGEGQQRIVDLENSREGGTTKTAKITREHVAQALEECRKALADCESR